MKKNSTLEYGFSTILLILVVFLIFVGAILFLFRNQISFLNDLNINLDNSTNISFASPDKRIELEEVTIGLVGGLGSFTEDRFYPFEEVSTIDLGVTTQYLEGLVNVDKNLKIQPLLAERWINTDDNKWRFYLRKNVTFSDGTPFTAEDVKFTIDIINQHATEWDEKGGYKRYLQTIQEVNIINPYEIEIVTNEVDRSLLNKLANILILSRNSFNPNITNKFPIGTGAYLLEKVGKDSDNNIYVELVRNENYWGEKAKVKKVIYKVIEDDTQRVNLLLNGELDIIEYVPSDKVEDIKNNPNFKFSQQLAQYITYIGFDVQRDKTPYTDTPKNPFKDIRVRQAIYQAINMDEVNKNTFQNMAETQSQLVNRFVVGYNPQIQRLPYDLEKAKQLMVEAGYGDGFNVTIDAPHQRIAQYISDIPRQLKNINIDATIRVINIEDINNFYAGDTSMYAIVWTFEEGEALNTLTNILHSRTDDGLYGVANLGNYKNPEVDTIIEQAQAETNEAKRVALMQEAMKKGMDDLAFIPLNSDLVGYAYAKNIDWSPRVDALIKAYEIAGLASQ